MGPEAGNPGPTGREGEGGRDLVIYEVIKRKNADLEENPKA